MARPSCKELLLDAAEAVVMDGGGARLTLDAVAERAGVSKGGVLYHFPNKAALLEGLLDRMLQEHANRRDAALEECAAEGVNALQADLISQLVTRDRNDKVGAALLAIVANDPDLMKERLLAFHRARFGESESDTETFATRAVLLLAADGLLFLEMLQVCPLTDAQRAAVIDKLLQIAGQSAGAATS